MNSLEIYEIPELKDIIHGYKQQFEYIDELEHELKYGSIDFEITIGSLDVRFEIDIRNNIRNIYINEELRCKDWDFINCLEEIEFVYVSDAIYQFIAKKILYRYCILPIDHVEYYFNIDAILHMIFDDTNESIFDTVENCLIDEYFACQLRHQELDQDVIINEDKPYCREDNKYFYNEILDYLNNEEPFIVRDNYTQIYDFFKEIYDM